MSLRKSTRLGVEVLEGRTVPSATASVVDGSLVVVGDPAAASNLTITGSDTNADGIADTFAGTDGATNVGAFGGVTGQIVLKLTENDDVVAIDLGGLISPRGVRANLGCGTNALTITNGTVNGDVRIRGGCDADTVLLGGATKLTVNGSLGVALDGGVDSLE